MRKKTSKKVIVSSNMNMIALWLRGGEVYCRVGNWQRIKFWLLGLQKLVISSSLHI